VKSKSGCEQPQISYANDICRLGRLMWLWFYVRLCSGQEWLEAVRSTVLYW